MAGSSLLVLLDDIAAVLDDVALMTKVAAKKTAGVLGDDLAVNAEKVSGVKADRELPVVWAVAKGSFRNKLILVPAALGISAVAPWAIVPILMLGGLYLCFEGFEKVAHTLFHKSEEQQEHAELIDKLSDPKLDPVQYEKDKIKGAIRTDFILSAEIIVISLGIVAESAFIVQVSVVAGIAIVMTVGVYGLVAGIVKLDDVGLYLSRREGEGFVAGATRWIGLRLLAFAPRLMKTLTIVGTIAMFLVGGGILAHGFHPIQAAFDSLSASASSVAGIGPVLQAVSPLLLNALLGIVAGALTLGVVKLVSGLFGNKAADH
jgi:predicted DNA repair protein MutK